MYPSREPRRYYHSYYNIVVKMADLFGIMTATTYRSTSCSQPAIASISML